MFNLRLNAKACMSCGICMDVCAPRAIAMRTKSVRSVEGNHLTYLGLRSQANPEAATAALETFPYMRAAALCDGCRRCVAECPAAALELRHDAANWQSVSLDFM